MIKDIAAKKHKYEKIYAKKYCGYDDISECPKGDRCECKKIAEIKAYMHSIVGSPYYNYSIWDFDGWTKARSENKKLLDTDVILEAKTRLLQYCWKGITLEDLSTFSDRKDDLDLNNKSVIGSRRDSGVNVVVYAPTGDGSPKGRTFVASLIMLEAIKGRYPNRTNESYKWIKFPMLQHYLSSSDSQVSQIENELKYCDWLVVDDITNKAGSSRASEQYLVSKIDPFFLERLEDKLPTIFVFRFDVGANSIRWEEQFGIAISGIVKDKKTCKINLS